MMNEIAPYWIFALGFTAQFLFGARILVQWWMTEKRGHVVAPALFWKLSLVASAIFLLYGLLRYDLVILIGQMIAYVIYIRNLQLRKAWSKFSLAAKILIITLPLSCIVATCVQGNRMSLSAVFLQDWNVFFIVGMIGQLLLNLRFVYQLLYSEKHRESKLPIGFWWMSLCGSVFIISYALYRGDPVLLTAQGLALIPYVRNIVLIRKANADHEVKTSLQEFRH